MSTILQSMQATLRAGVVAGGVETASLGQAVAGMQCADGGFPDRAGDSDLYYSSFAYQVLSVLSDSAPRRTLQATPPEGQKTIWNLTAAKAWLTSFGEGEALDLIHFICLIRSRCLLGMLDVPTAATAGGRLMATTPANLYETFLIAWAQDDLGLPPSRAEWPAEIIKTQRPSGGFANTPGGAATTPTTVAAVSLLEWMQQPVPPAAIDFLQSQRTEAGSFQAAPIAPMGDLLSTAVTLRVLSQLGPISQSEQTRQFILSCRSEDGLFAPIPDQSVGDAEFVFYGLLALGALEEAK